LPASRGDATGTIVPVTGPVAVARACVCLQESACDADALLFGLIREQNGVVGGC